MSDDAPLTRLAGQWRRPLTADDLYPELLLIRADGIYTGRKGATGQAFTLWDVGRMEMIAADQVKVSTANDAEIVYQVNAEADRLSFQDQQGTKIYFERERAGVSPV